MSKHWLYKIIPASREETNFFTWIFWCFYGNDEGGIFGEKDPYYTVLLRTEPKQSLWQFIYWWFRNPFHNLFFHVLRWSASSVRVLFSSHPKRWWFKDEQKNWAHDTDPQLRIVLYPPLISWRTKNWEGYAGFRIHGALGFAFRKFPRDKYPL